MPRRHRLEIIRDALIVLELNGRPMKPTRIMYGLNVSWTPLIDLLEALTKRKLIKEIKPETSREESRTVPDGRSNELYEITLKGKYILRLLNELLEYMDDESEPVINPPVWMLRKALKMRGFALEHPEKMDRMQFLEPVEVQGPTVIEEQVNAIKEVEKPKRATAIIRMKGDRITVIPKPLKSEGSTKSRS